MNKLINNLLTRRHNMRTGMMIVTSQFGGNSIMKGLPS